MNYEHRDKCVLVKCSNSPLVAGKFVGVLPFAMIGTASVILFVVTVEFCKRA